MKPTKAATESGPNFGPKNCIINISILGNVKFARAGSCVVDSLTAEGVPYDITLPLLVGE